MKNLLDEITQEQKRFLAISLAIFLVMGASLWAVLAFVNKTEEAKTKPVTTLTISDKDREEVSLISKQFTQQAGTWGLKSAPTKDTILQDRYDVQTSRNGSSRVWSDRKDVYKNLQSAYMVENTPIYYFENQYGLWDDSDAKENLYSFKSSNIASTVDSSLDRVSYKNKMVDEADVQVSFNSTVTAYNQTGDDEKWDGNFVVTEKIFPTSLRMSLIKVSGVWKIYSVTEVTHSHVLATNPEAIPDYPAYMQGAKEVGKIKAVLDAK